jgi:hypothetical protein
MTDFSCLSVTHGEPSPFHLLLWLPVTRIQVIFFLAIGLDRDPPPPPPSPATLVAEERELIPEMSVPV